MRTITKYTLLLFALSLCFNQSKAQEKWLTSQEYNSIQKQSINAIELLGDLLDNIVFETQYGGINEYYEPNNPQQIFQDGSVLVTNEINPKSKTFLSVSIKSYLNYWYTNVNNKTKSNDNEVKVEFVNIFVSPVFLENKIAFSKVYFQKLITYNSKVDILNKFAIVRSIYTENGWLSLISGIDLLDEEIMIDEYSTTKELLSVRNELGMLTESIKKDSTIISYNNFKQFITPEYSRTNFSDIYNSSYYYDENLYQCAINDYKVLLKKDSISVISPEVESVFHTSGFDVLNISTGFHATLEGEKKLEINSSGCFHFIMDESIATITNDNSIILQSSPENDRLDFTQTFENIKSLNCDDFDFEVLYKNYQINFLLKEDKLNLKYKDFTEQKTIISSNTSLHNMEHIRVDDGAGRLQQIHQRKRLYYRS